MPEAERTAGAAARRLTLRIGVVGLGVTGLPLLRAFVAQDAAVIGVDLAASRLSELAGAVDCPITSDHRALAPCNAVIVCVQTPLTPDCRADVTHVKAAVAALRTLPRQERLLIIQSTLPIGATREITRAAGITPESGWKIAYSPERVSPGPAHRAWKLSQVPRIIGGIDEVSVAAGYDVLSLVFENVRIARSLEEAEATKLLENSFRLANIALVNQISDLYRSIGLEPRRVIQLAATKPYAFLQHDPSLGAGGDCIPVDPNFLLAASGDGNSMSVLRAALDSNRERPLMVSHKILRLLKETDPNGSVLVAGVTYKPDVADIRQAAPIKMLAELHSAGVTVGYTDPYIPELVLCGGLTCRSRPWRAEEVSRWTIVVLCIAHDQFRRWTPVWDAACTVVDLTGAFQEQGQVLQW